MKTGIPSPSITIIATLMLMTLSSAAVFFILVRRWTTRREWVSLSEWAKKHRLKRLRSDDARPLPPPIDQLATISPRVRLEIGDASTIVMQFDSQVQRGRWNVLIRKRAGGRKSAAAAVRPASLAEKHCAIDLFALTPFHSLGNDRFSVLAGDARSANQLAASSARALLPPDVGLLVHDDLIMLDFSTRPLDPVELDRMISVSEQIIRAI